MGSLFKEKQQYESMDELFTKRNLYALAILMEAIEDEENKIIKDFLKLLLLQWFTYVQK